MGQFSVDALGHFYCVANTLRHPDWALPVLAAYGVSTVQGWPTAFPSYAAVRDEVAYRGRRGHGPLTEQPVSLKALLAKEARDAEIVSASFMDLHDVRLKRPWKLALIASGAALLAAGLVQQPSWSDLSLLSASIGAIVLLTVMFFAQTLAVPRRRIESERR